MRKPYDTNIFEQNLLMVHPKLKAISNLYKRFYTYRAMTEGEFVDIDRSDIVKNVYKNLKWYTENDDKFLLEPDTFFASSHNLIRRLFKKYDSNYYVEDFKKYCRCNNINYDTLTEEDARYNRYRWMIEPNVMSHYNYIISNPSLLDYIDTTHEIGNFMIIPKGFGWELKCKLFNESPFKSLSELELNWEKYSNNYKSIDSFDEFKELFILNDFYSENGMLNSTLDIDFHNNSFPEIFKKMQMLSKLIKIRTGKIIKSVNKTINKYNKNEDGELE